MPDNSRVQFGFAFLTPTGKPVKSARKKLEAMHRFFKSGGVVNDIDGVHVVARWRNPEDRSARSREWKTTDDPGQSLEDFSETMAAVLVIAERRVEADYEAYQRTKRFIKRTTARASALPRRRQAKKPRRPRRKV